eukprot:15184350-Heterocapsa_arctica.AAC.1
MAAGARIARAGIIDGGLEIVPAGARDEDRFEQRWAGFLAVESGLRVGQSLVASVEYEPAWIAGFLRMGPEQNDRGDRKVELAVRADFPDVVSAPGRVPVLKSVDFLF